MSITVEDVLEALPTEERKITERLRKFLLELEPRLMEGISYGVPYYRLRHQLFFIWPVSAPWAPKAKNQTVDDTKVGFGFCRGNMLSNDYGILLKENRKQVYIVRIKSLAQINQIEPALRQAVLEAIVIDEEGLPIKSKKSR